MSTSGFLQFANRIQSEMLIGQLRLREETPLQMRAVEHECAVPGNGDRASQVRLHPRHVPPQR